MFIHESIVLCHMNAQADIDDHDIYTHTVLIQSAAKHNTELYVNVWTEA